MGNDVINFIFFFQAKNGIRGAQESRGLGGVYKRQIHNKTVYEPQTDYTGLTKYTVAVSNKHLTLPTNREVKILVVAVNSKKKKSYV